MMFGLFLLVFGLWPEAPWNLFRGKSDQRAGTLAVQLAGIYEDHMLSWVLFIKFILRYQYQYLALSAFQKMNAFRKLTLWGLQAHFRALEAFWAVNNWLNSSKTHFQTDLLTHTVGFHETRWL